MSNRTITWLTIVAVAAVCLLLILNAVPMFFAPKTEKYLKYNDVKGMAVDHNGKLFTLNFKQQNEIVSFFNQAVPAEKADKLQEMKEISKIIIYRFDKPELTIYLEGVNSSNDVIFSNSEWNPSGLMQDVSRGKLKTLLSKTYDP